MIDIEVRTSETMRTSNIDHEKCPFGARGSDEQKKNEFILTFDNFVDLQTRLVLLPLNDSECTGAVVESYVSRRELENCEERIEQGPIKAVLEGESSQAASGNTLIEHKVHDENANKITDERGPNQVTDDVQTDSGSIHSSGEVKKMNTCTEDELSHIIGEEDRSEGDQEKKLHNSATQINQEMEIDESQSETNSTKRNDRKRDGDTLMGEEEQSHVTDKVLGATLKNIPGLYGNEEIEWTTQDFTEILSLLRDAPTPINLLFDSSSKQGIESKVGDELKYLSSDGSGCSSTEEGMTDRDTLSSSCSSCSSSSDSTSDQEECGGASANVLKGRFQRWGSQLQQKKTILTEEAWKAANAAKEIAKDRSVNPNATNSNSEQEVIVKEKVEQNHDPCGMFLQTSSGKCISLSPSLYKNKSRFRKAPPVITNTSVLVIRTSAQKPCPTKGYTFQWFRSHSKINDGDEREADWFLLEGATSVVFQPSATDVGHRIKCTISLSVNNGGRSLTANCELLFPIELDKTLFTAAMKSFFIPQDLPGVHRSSFENMVGTGKFDRIQFYFDMHTKQDHYDGKQGGFYMNISSKGTDLLPIILDKPLVHVYAIANPSNNKNFGLYFPRNDLKSIDNNFLSMKFQAPSRLARETFLIALGVSRYSGLIADLDTGTLLFPHVPEISTAMELENDSSPLSRESVNEEPISKSNNETGKKEDNKTKGEEVEEEVIAKTKYEESEDLEEQPEQICAALEIKSPFCSKMLAIESELEEDMDLLKHKLECKNKVVTDLQEELKTTKESSRSKTIKFEDCSRSLRLADKRIDSLQEEIIRLKGDLVAQNTSHEERMKSLKDAAVEQEKMFKSFANEKAVMTAAIEARDAKLTNMLELQEEVVDLKEKVDEGNVASQELRDMNEKCEKLTKKVSILKSENLESRKSHETLQESVEKLEKQLNEETMKSLEYKSRFEKSNSIVQRLKGEKNMFRQKADSLAKEMSRICRNGKGIHEIEKLIHDHEVLMKEVSLLKAQKKEAFEDLEQSRSAYESILEAHALASIDGEAVRAIQRRMDLERVVADLTEYVNAKEMQLETTREINRALTEEMHMMVQHNLSNNDV